MAKLKLGAIADDKPVKLTVELPADVITTSRPTPTCSPAKRAGDLGFGKAGRPMLARVMATDRAFAKSRRKGKPVQGK